eukprot:SRR837773.14053.p2 GENE.SRR837773.14053~~SRR837773.14053.p2  ORF type:complete len:260 (+),score=125.69 SRR837773.14053:52-831(+)
MAPEKDKKKEEKAEGKAAKEEADPMEPIVKLMEERDFVKAGAEITKLLKKKPDDAVLLHNLGVVYTEQEKWAEAEETFTEAFEAQKKAKFYNDATLFGLATVLTEQGGMGKLLQAEALFRDCLDRAIAKEEHGILETYKAFQALGDNLGRQKRWGEATEAYKQALDMGGRMFPEDHQQNRMGRAMLSRAQRLAKMQRYIRVALWTATAAVPIFCAWTWNKVGGPSLGELFAILTGTNATELVLSPDAAALADGVSAPHG